MSWIASFFQRNLQNLLQNHLPVNVHAQRGDIKVNIQINYLDILYKDFRFLRICRLEYKTYYNIIVEDIKKNLIKINYVTVYEIKARINVTIVN